jgi:hypothetical protein
MKGFVQRAMHAVRQLRGHGMHVLEHCSQQYGAPSLLEQRELHQKGRMSGIMLRAGAGRQPLIFGRGHPWSGRGVPTASMLLQASSRVLARDASAKRSIDAQKSLSI